MKTLRLAILISGRGSNLQALIDACKKSDFPAEIAVVISNTPDAPGLARAADACLPAMIVDHTYFKGDKPAFENALAAIVEQHQANFVCLAGFMRMLGPTFLTRFKDKVINIHPSLLPKHKGLDVHSAVLTSGDKKSGCSVHVVTAGMDEGPVLAQREVPVKKGDTAETLAARILKEEHILYPEVIKKIAMGRIVIKDAPAPEPKAEPATIIAITPAAPAAVESAVESKSSVGHHSPARKESEKAPMSHASHAAHSQDPAHDAADLQAVQRAQQAWSFFTKATLIAGGAVAVVLVLMATFLV